MKQLLKTTFTVIGFSLVTFGQAQAFGTSTPAGKMAIDRSGPLTKIPTIRLCVDYSTLKSEAEKQQYIKELDLRSQLSEVDHKYALQGKVQPNMTRCGMYMALGKPLQESSRQIRPMTFKTVHIYPDMYYVSQSGMLVDAYERKEGVLPPTLYPEKPEVAESPTLKK